MSGRVWALAAIFLAALGVVIGSLAYLTPLLSTLNLMAFAGQKLTGVSFLAMFLIILGAVLGTRQT